MTLWSSPLWFEMTSCSIGQAVDVADASGIIARLCHMNVLKKGINDELFHGSSSLKKWCNFPLCNKRFNVKLPKLYPPDI